MFAGGLTEQGVTGWTTWGRQNSNPQFQDPFVINPRINYSWIAGRHSFKTGYEYQASTPRSTTSTRSTGRDTYGGQFSRPAGAAADPATYNLADFMFGARNPYELINPFIANLRQRMHFAYLQDDCKVDPRLTLNLGLRYEFATPQWEEDNLLTNFDPATNTLHPGEGRLDLRPRAGQPRHATTSRRASALAYSVNEQDGHPRRLRHRATSTSTGWAARTCSRSTARTSSPITITQQPSQGLCAGNQAPTTCFRTTQQGYPEGLTRAGELQPAERARQLHPAGQPDRQRPELARHRAARAAAEPARRRRLRRQQEPQHHDPRRLQPGAAERARPRTLSLQARRPIQGFQFIQTAFGGGKGDYHALQVKVERRYSRGLYLLNSFTWSRARDNASGHLESAERRQQPRQLPRLEARVRPVRLRPAAQQHDQRACGSCRSARIGAGRRTCTPVVEAILGGWRLIGINTMTSGLPVNLNYSPAAAFTVSDGADLPAEPHRRSVTPEDERTHHQLVQPGQQSTIPTDRQQPFGNAPRNVARGPALYVSSISGCTRAFGLGRTDPGFEVRIEAFNVLNKTNFGAPNGNVRDQLRDHHDAGDAGAADPAGREVRLLIC